MRTVNGAVVVLTRSYQLMNPAESQDQCGPWSVAELKFGALPGSTPGTIAQIHQWAVQEYTAYIGPDVTSDQNGSSIANMHAFLQDAGLQGQDIAAISSSSPQESDLANLHAALDAGYPVLVTVNEQSVVRRDGTNPYPWQPRLGPVNHIFTVVGYTDDGYLLVADELNAADVWPDQYSEAAIDCHWACVVRMTGLAALPAGDPASWPVGFDAQNGGAMQTYSPKAADFNQWFSVVDATHWVCKKYNTTIQLGLLGLYCQLSIDGNTLPLPGLPLTNELYFSLPDKAGTQQVVAVTICERAALVWDDAHVLDSQPGFGSAYLMKLTDPHLLKLLPGLQLPTQVPAQVLTDIKALLVAAQQLATDAGVA